MDKVFKDINRFIVPGILVLIGILALIVGTNQVTLFTIGGIGLIIVGLLSVVYTLGLIDKKMHVILLVLFTLGAAFYAYKSYRSVQDEIDFRVAKSERLDQMIPKFNDIRDAEKAFAERHGRYTASFDTLIEFIKNDSIMEITKEGGIPAYNAANCALLGVEMFDVIQAGGFTEAQALALDSLDPTVTFIRDTFYRPAIDYWNEIGDSAQVAQRVFPNVLDSMRYVPYQSLDEKGKVIPGHKEFILEAGWVDRGKSKLPVFCATDPDPFDKHPKSEPWKVGSMEEPTFAGNWKRD